VSALCVPLRFGDSAGLLRPIAHARSQKDDILIFEIAQRPGEFPIAAGLSVAEILGAEREAAAFLANPLRYPRSGESTVFSWPDFS